MLLKIKIVAKEIQIRLTWLTTFGRTDNVLQFYFAFWLRFLKAALIVGCSFYSIFITHVVGVASLTRGA